MPVFGAPAGTLRSMRRLLLCSAAVVLLAATAAAPASASTTYGVASGAWSERFTFNGCQLRVKWGTEAGTGVARARFYTRYLSRCRAASEPSGGSQWMGALDSVGSALPIVMPGRRLSGVNHDACGAYVEWKATLPGLTGLEIDLENSGRLKSPFFRVEAHGRPLPSPHSC
jgi:hypothetical protein